MKSSSNYKNEYEMSRQYQNALDFVTHHCYFIVTPKDEYCILEQKQRTLIFEWPSHHEMTLGHAVFINKKSKFTREKLIRYE